MIKRVLAAISKALGGAAEGASPRPVPNVDHEQSADIDFRPISAGELTSTPLETSLCPVTRKSLGPGDRVYQCRMCHTSYSVAGWEFLRDVDHSRCCACGQKNSVTPVQ